jgi:hypothetical protein
VSLELLDHFFVFNFVELDLVVKVGLVLVGRFELFFQMLEFILELSIFNEQWVLNQGSHELLLDLVGLR